MTQSRIVRLMLVIAVTFAFAITAGVVGRLMTSDVRQPQCSADEESGRALDLRLPADRDHLRRDVDRIQARALRFKDEVRKMPSPDSRVGLMAVEERPERALRYCLAMQIADVARTHSLNPRSVQESVVRLADRDDGSSGGAGRP